MDGWLQGIIRAMLYSFDTLSCGLVIPLVSLISSKSMCGSDLIKDKSHSEQMTDRQEQPKGGRRKEVDTSFDGSREEKEEEAWDRR